MNWLLMVDVLIVCWITFAVSMTYILIQYNKRNWLNEASLQTWLGLAYVGAPIYGLVRWLG